MLGKQHTEVFVYDYMTIPHSINTMRCKKKYSKVSSIKGCSFPARIEGNSVSGAMGYSKLKKTQHLWKNNT